MPDDAILIVEDDQSFGRTLQRSFERRGLTVLRVDGLHALNALLEQEDPTYAVVDLKLASGTGLQCIKRLHEHNPARRIVVLTGFASIATAVEAIKLGACHYLAKPSNTDDIIAAFQKYEGDTTVSAPARSTSIKTLEWEKIHETLIESEFNISETARRLGMHRRTLARKLEKWRVK